MVIFADRWHAGALLAGALAFFRGHDVIVLGLPRGGVPVASQVAAALGAPLDVIVVRKLGVPYRPDLAMGAIGEGGARIVDHHLLASAGVTSAELDAVESRERVALETRLDRLRRGRPAVDLAGRIAVVVDDGIATGSTARAACQVARRLGAARVIVAAPVAPPGIVGRLPEADDVVCVALPDGFVGVGAYYRDFTPTSDHEVVGLLDAAPDRTRDDRPGRS